MVPLLATNPNPAGRLPEATDQVYGVVPFVAEVGASGRKRKKTREKQRNNGSPQASRACDEWDGRLRVHSSGDPLEDSTF